MMRRWIGAALLLVAGAASAGDIYVCTGEHGEKMYQNAPCPAASKQLGHNQYSDAMARAPAPPPEAYRADPPSTAPAVALNAPSTALPRPGSHGMDSSAYQRGDVLAMKCVNARGKVYYVRGACGVSTTTIANPEADGWHNDRVDGMPGAVMVSPDQALDPMTGKIVELQSRAPDFGARFSCSDQASGSGPGSRSQ